MNAEQFVEQINLIYCSYIEINYDHNIDVSGKIKKRQMPIAIYFLLYGCDIWTLRGQHRRTMEASEMEIWRLLKVISSWLD